MPAMTILRAILIVLIGISASVPLARAEVVDLTTVRCKEWLEADPARSQRFLDWIAGYYGALVGSTIYDSEIRAANEAHLRDVCAINPISRS